MDSIITQLLPSPVPASVRDANEPVGQSFAEMIGGLTGLSPGEPPADGLVEAKTVEAASPPRAPGAPAPAPLLLPEAAVEQRSATDWETPAFGTLAPNSQPSSFGGMADHSLAEGLESAGIPDPTKTANPSLCSSDAMPVEVSAPTAQPGHDLADREEAVTLRLPQARAKEVDQKNAGRRVSEEDTLAVVDKPTAMPNATLPGQAPASPHAEIPSAAPEGRSPSKQPEPANRDGLGHSAPLQANATVSGPHLASNQGPSTFDPVAEPSSEGLPDFAPQEKAQPQTAPAGRTDASTAPSPAFEAMLGHSNQTGRQTFQMAGLAPAAATARPLGGPVVPARPGQIGRAMGIEVARAVRSGQQELVVRLDPEHMGRIEAKISFGVDGALRAVLRADHPATVEMLRRDAPLLAQAFSDAGLQADGQSLSFTLSGNDSHNSRGRRHEQNDPHQPRRDGYPQHEEDAPPTRRLPLAGGRVDLMA